jgi:hypothetical protein
VNPKASVIVPSRGRPTQLGRLLECLSAQTEREFEVIVALDGEGGAPAKLPELSVEILNLPQVGISDAKNRALDRSRGDVLIFVNDDVEPETDFIAQHLAAQNSNAEHSRPGLVLGASPFAALSDPTVFDAAIAETRMIFFYQGLEAGRCYDFRHAWNLNLSLPRSALQHTPPFASPLRPCMYEDLELAHRLLGTAPGVLFHPQARALHRHRYDLKGYFVREVLLGLMAVPLWRTNPGCFQAVFGSDVEAVQHKSEVALAIDHNDARRSLATLVPAAAEPWTAETPLSQVHLWYVAHLPLKRRAFRLGAVASERWPEAEWPSRPQLAKQILETDSIFGDWFAPRARALS